MQLFALTALASLAIMFQTSSAASWNDGNGPIDDGFMSVVLWVPLLVDARRHQNYAIIIQDYDHNGDDAVSQQPLCAGGDDWATINSFLPWTVDVKKGNDFCQSGSPDTWTDVVINYAGWHGVFTSCTKCAPLPGNQSGRCLIPLTPDGGC